VRKLLLQALSAERFDDLADEIDVITEDTQWAARRSTLPQVCRPFEEKGDLGAPERNRESRRKVLPATRILC
jgi:hypothetical protein